MTLAEFNAQKDTRPCRSCDASPVYAEDELNNGGTFVRCLNCRLKHAWIGVQYLQKSDKPKRREYPFGQSVDEVWARADNRCIVCTATADELQGLGIGRQRHHVTPYKDAEHQGLILPICVACHELATGLQRNMARVSKALQHARRHDPAA